MHRSLYQLFPELPHIRVLDVGASPIDGEPPYKPLYDADKMDLVAVEPDDEQFAALQAMNLPRTTLLKAALGDGKQATLRVCEAPGMTSLLEPYTKVLQHFHGFPSWAEVKERKSVQTRRLDDVADARGCHYMKLDVQGGELSILENGRTALEDTLMVHIEVQFVPFYKDQPLFGELDQLLRAAGFWLHRFLPMHSRVFKPLVVKNDVYAGLSQVLWTDAVFVRRFVDFPSLPPEDLERIAVLAHDLYGSFDLASLALLRRDEMDGGDRQPRYVQAMGSGG